MKWKMSPLMLAAIVTSVLVCGVGIIYALDWYSSQPKTTTVTDVYLPTLNDIPASVMKDSTLTLSGTVFKGAAAASGVTVHIFRNDIEVTSTVTNAQGAYTASYTVSDNIGSVLTFEARVNNLGT